MRKLLLIAVLLTVAVPNAWARPHYDGTYKCDGPNGPVTFVLHEAASGVISGTMTSEGETLKVNGTATAQGAHATISGDEPEDAFDADMVLDGGKLSVDLHAAGDPNAKMHLDFDREGGAPSTPATPSKPAAKRQSTKVKPTVVTHVSTSYAGWKTYRNATGISIKYPSTWTAAETSGVLKLEPPDAGSNANGATETYFVIAQSSDGVEDVDDPRVAQAAQATVAQVMPFLQMQGEPQPVPANHRGVLMTWTGDNPQGMHVLAKSYSAIIEGYSISVVGLGESSLVGKRTPILQKMFTSLSAGSGDIDERLVGRWHYWSYHSSSTGSHSEEVDIHVELAADGTCRMSKKSENEYSFTSGTGENEGGGVADNSGGDVGHWNASKGKLFVKWNAAGASAYEYALVGNQLNVRAVGSSDKPAEWNRE